MALSAERPWQTLDEYLGDIDRARSHPFVLNDTVESFRTGEDTMATSGEVFCRNDVTIEVDLAGDYKRRGNPPFWHVRLALFRYNAYLRGVDDSTFLRYDQGRSADGPPFSYHVHRWNPHTRAHLDDHTPVSYADMPTLLDVVREVASLFD